MKKALYHYTTNDGLIGIQSSSQFHLSEYFCLNDKFELIAGQEIIKEIFSEEFEKEFEKLNTRIDLLTKSESDNKPDVLQDDEFRRISRNASIFHTIANNFSSDVSSEFFSIFVMCFSEKRDLLSQWKGYSDNGKGFCLGFETKELLDKIILGNKKTSLIGSNGEDILFLGKVIYQKEQLRQKVNLIVKKVADLLKTNDAIDKKEIIEHVTAVSLILSAFYKLEEFKEENEWRLIVINFHANENVSYRSSLHGISSYYKLEITPSLNKLIFEIIIGPKYDNEKNYRTLVRFIDPAKIAASKLNLQ